MSAEQPTDEIDPREVVTAYLERERELWLPHYQHAKRDGFANAELNAAAEAYMPKINQLLDELNRLGTVAVRGAL